MPVKFLELRPIIKMQQSRFAADGVLLFDFHHLDPIGSFVDVRAVSVQCQDAISLAYGCAEPKDG